MRVKRSKSKRKCSEVCNEAKRVIDHACTHSYSRTTDWLCTSAIKLINLALTKVSCLP